MKTTVLFITILALTSFITAAPKAFEHVNGLLTNFKASINQEQKDADVRHQADTKMCNIKIQEAVELVARRQKDVDELKKHIKFLKHEKKENEHDKKTRQDRLVANKKMLETFKKERCDNNLLFVKQLREHMEAIDILTLLRKDINEYFANRKSKKVGAAFIERFAEFSHLLDEENRAVFAELEKTIKKQLVIEENVDALHKKVDASTAAKQRTAAEVGKDHVDNTRGALKKLAHVGHTEVGVYVDALHKKVIIMIDGLILHLKNSRNDLTKNEIKAAEDFAIFQTQMEKENEYLKVKIIELEKRIQDLTNQINVASAQLVKREKLLANAQEEERTIRRICKEKQVYYTNESNRRNGELATVAQAQSLFNVLMKKSSRVLGRASEHKISAGKKGFSDKLSAHVRRSKKAMKGSLKTRQTQRNKVVFF
jgi:hypothetical protein